MPFLVILSLSGLIYLFRTEIENTLYADRVYAPAPSLTLDRPAKDLQTQAKFAEDSFFQGESNVSFLKAVLPPTSPDRSTQFVFSNKETNNETSVFVDPYTAKVTGSLDESTRISSLALKAHSELFVGQFGDLLLELAASWTVLLIGTGLFLWVPNARTLPKLLLPRFAAKGREFWKSLHGSIGLWISVFLLFFCITGLFWSGVWGAKIVKPWNTFPDVIWNDVPKSDLTSKDLNSSFEKQVPWAIEDAAVPVSSGHHQEVSKLKNADKSQSDAQTFDWKNSKVSLDEVQKIASNSGMYVARSISIPKDLTGVFSVSTIARSANEEKMIHIDQHSGKTLASVGFESYPLLAKGVSMGIALHEGRQLGAFNKWFVALLCVLLFVLCLSASVLWWKRRPTWKQLKAPSRVQLVGSRAKIFVALAAFCFFFPTAGISLGLVWIVDSLLMQSSKT
jgi:uncharacterized iron-regulated membrane protein